MQIIKWIARTFVCKETRCMNRKSEGGEMKSQLPEIKEMGDRLIRDGVPRPVGSDRAEGCGL